MHLARSSFNTCFVFVWRFDPVFRYWLDLPISLSIGKLFKIRKVLNQFQIRNNQYKFRGTQWEILRKRPNNSNKAWIKLSEVILSIIAKIHLFLTPSKTAWWKSSQPARCTYNLQLNLVWSFPADVCPVITCQFGCGHRAKFSPSVGGGGGRVGFG